MFEGPFVIVAVTITKEKVRKTSNILRISKEMVSK